MSVLVFVEHDEGKVKKSSKEAVCYAAALGDNVTALVLGEADQADLEKLGKNGASKVLHALDSRLNNGNIQAYASAIHQAMNSESAELLIFAKSSISDAVAARTAIKQDASLATNVSELPDKSTGFRVKRSIYTGKAFAWVELKNLKKIIGIKKNATTYREDGENAAVESFNPSFSDADWWNHNDLYCQPRHERHLVAGCANGGFTASLFRASRADKIARSANAVG